MRPDYVLFDFDGTLFDTSEGILKGIRTALESAGIAAGQDKELYKFIGPPVVQAFKEFYGMSEEEASNEVLNPPQDVVDRCEFFLDVSDHMDLYEEIWMDVRTAN